MDDEQIVCIWECASCKRIRETRHPVDASVADLEAKRPEICLCENDQGFQFKGIRVTAR